MNSQEKRMRSEKKLHTRKWEEVEDISYFIKKICLRSMQCLAITLGWEILTFFSRKFGDGKVVVYMTVKPDGAESERVSGITS